MFPDTEPGLTVTQSFWQVTAGWTPLVTDTCCVPPSGPNVSSDGLAASFTGSGSGVFPPQAQKARADRNARIGFRLFITS